MVCNVACVEAEHAVRPDGGGERRVDLRVLDDLHLAAAARKDADGLCRVRLCDDLCTGIDAALDAKADKHGIADAHEAIVHAVHVDVLDTATGNVAQNALRVERTENAAIAVGRHGERVGGRAAHQAARQIKAGELALAEKDDLARQQAKVRVRLEETARLLVRVLARHDVPRDGAGGRPSKALQARDPLGLEAVERTARCEANVVHALGKCGSKTRTLAARHEERAHLASSYGLEAEIAPASRRGSIRRHIIKERGIERLDGTGDRRRIRRSGRAVKGRARMRKINRVKLLCEAVAPSFGALGQQLAHLGVHRHRRSCQV